MDRSGCITGNYNFNRPPSSSPRRPGEVLMSDAATASNSYKATWRGYSFFPVHLENGSWVLQDILRVVLQHGVYHANLCWTALSVKRPQRLSIYGRCEVLSVCVQRTPQPFTFYSGFTTWYPWLSLHGGYTLSTTKLTRQTHALSNDLLY